MKELKATILIKGRVQGVFFRAYIKEHALKLGLRGYIRNLPLRRVEAIFVGQRDQIEKIISYCQKGPPLASVSEISVSWNEPDQQYQNFDIYY